VRADRAAAIDQLTAVGARAIEKVLSAWSSFRIWPLEKEHEKDQHQQARDQGEHGSRAPRLSGGLAFIQLPLALALWILMRLDR